MTANGWLQILLFLAVVLLVTKPLGVFMARVFARERTFMDPVLRPLERLVYRVTGVDENHESASRMFKTRIASPEMPLSPAAVDT